MFRGLLLVRVVFLALLSFVFTFSVVMAAPTGYTWDRNSINPLPYFYENWVSSDTKTAFYAAANSWNTATSNKVGYTFNSAYKVYAGEMNDKSAEWDGITDLTQNGTTIIAADSWLNIYFTASYSVEMRKSTAAHELGHALGLDEDYDNQLALMNPSTYERKQFKIYDPTPIEVYWINQMYP